VLIAGGVACQIMQVYVSIRDRARLRDATGDPWDGRTLEWSTSSPPPPFNYAVLPQVADRDAFWLTKHTGDEPEPPRYETIEMPRNSATGVVCAFFAVLMGFALVWHIWWLLALGFLGAWATFVVFAWRDRGEEQVSAAELRKADRSYRKAQAQ
jgi:cytochrome o ubiquinol oxidase subunit 1